MNDKAKKVMCDMMENKIDKFMSIYNFHRKGKSLNYSRRINSTKQNVEMLFFSHPSYHPGAIMHIYPWMSVYYPEVNEIANRMINDIKLVAGLKKNTIRQPIQIFTDSERWMLFHEDERSSLAEEICTFLETRTIPLLNRLEQISNFIEIYESKDKRVMMGDAQYVFIVSAYVLQCNYEKAKEVLEERFGKAGPRRQYESLFSYVDNEMRNYLCCNSFES